LQEKGSGIKHCRKKSVRVLRGGGNQKKGGHEGEKKVVEPAEARKPVVGQGASDAVKKRDTVGSLAGEKRGRSKEEIPSKKKREADGRLALEKTANSESQGKKGKESIEKKNTRKGRVIRKVSGRLHNGGGFLQRRKITESRR